MQCTVPHHWSRSGWLIAPHSSSELQLTAHLLTTQRMLRLDASNSDASVFTCLCSLQLWLACMQGDLEAL